MGILMGLGVVLVICLILFLATRPLSETDKKTLEAMMKQSNTSGSRSSSANRTNTRRGSPSANSTLYISHSHYDDSSSWGSSDSSSGSSGSGGGD